jgi:hypothetical protein
MKNMNRHGLGLALGLGLLLSSFGFAQTITQTDQKKTSDSCCAMACCNHDSISKTDAKEHSAKHEGCCSGDSCNMKMKDGAKNHAAGATMAGCCGCCGDSCDMKMKESAKAHAAGAGCCCCGGDSCEMHMKDMKHKEKKGNEADQRCGRFRLVWLARTRSSAELNHDFFTIPPAVFNDGNSSLAWYECAGVCPT